MKKILSIMAMILLAAAGVYGQSPSPGIFNYQGVARNSVGNVLVNKTITLRLTIHDGTAVGPTVYQESRSTITNPFGLFNVQVGSGGTITQTGTIAGVNWGVGNKYIQVEIDPNGGSTFINIGTAQIASVPYSLYSSLSNDLVLPFNKTQADAGTLFRVNNSGAGGGLMGTAVSGDGVRGTSTSAFGVSGATGASNGAGVLGDGTGTGNSAGVMGRSGEGSYPGTSVNAGVAGRANANYGVAGYALSGTGVYGSSNTGNSGRFENTNAANTAPTLNATTNGTSGSHFAIRGEISSASPGGFSAGVRGINNGTGGSGIGVWGSQAGSGWGVLGEAPNGIGVYGSALGTGTGVNGYSDNGIGVSGFSNLNGRAAVFAIQTAGAASNANNVLTATTVGLGRVGYFENTNATNASTAVEIRTNGPLASKALGVYNIGFGPAAEINILNAASVNNALQINNFGLGRGALIQSTNASNNANIIDAFNAGPGWVLNIASSNATPKAIRTQGALQFTGIGEAANRILTSDVSGNATWQAAAAVGVVTGSGTLNFLPKWTPTGTALGNSMFYDDASNANLGGGAGGNRPSSLTLWQTPGTSQASLLFRSPGGELNGIHSENDGKLYFTANTSDPLTADKIMTLDDDNARGVGIGTTNPATKLHVVETGATAITSEVSYGAGLSLFTYRASNITSGANSNMGLLSFNNTSSSLIPGWRAGVVGVDSSNDFFASGVAGFYKGNTPAIGVYGRSAQNFNYSASATVNTLGFTGGNFIGGDAGVAAYVAGPGTSTNKYAVWASNPGGGTNWAGMFQGQVAIVDGTEGAGKVFTSDASGNGSWQGPVHMSAGSMAAVSIPSGGVSTDITTWGTLDEAGGANFTPGTGTYTIPATGYYSISLHLSWGAAASSSGASEVKCQIKRNGSVIAQGYSQQTTTGEIPDDPIANIELTLTAGDTITFAASQNTSAAMSLQGGSFWGKFGIHLVHR